MSFIDSILALALSLPPLALLALVFASAWLEFVFPPYFGDSVMLFGFFLAGQGAASPLQVFVAAVLGSVLGSMVAFWLGERYGAAALERLARFKRLGGSGRIERLRTLLARHGERVLVINRFVPFLRNFMLYGAGASRLRFLPSMAANAISVFAFSIFLMSLGMMAAGSFEQLQASFQKIFGLTGTVVLLVVVAALALAGRRQPMAPSGAGSPGAGPT